MMNPITPCPTCGIRPRVRRGTRCRECMAEYQRNYEVTNRDKIREKKKAYYRAHVEQFRGYRRSAKGKTRLKYLYGLTPTGVSDLLRESDGLCAICAEEPAVHIDHNHLTGEVRGALCRGCNQGLGHLKDDPEILRAAIEYLATPRVLPHFQVR
jgi:hypothetical protein